MSPTPPANSLLDALSAGRPEAFAALYERLGMSLLRVGRAMAGSHEEAEDAVQDVFVSLAKSRERLAGVEDLEAYVFAVLRNVVAARATRRKKEQAKLREMALAVTEAREPRAAGEDGLEAALASLPAEQREVVALKIDGGLTFSQIAQVLGVSPNTAASRYRYALEKLRTALEERP
ncbi:MAG: polymerase sigma-70 factor [Phycisphaerales bacterium]|nr:polymerase sigma-70 factor [Phycisphaerales bacterium]